MSSFTPEQVGQFREIFRQFSSDEVGGVSRANFIPAIEAALQHCHFTGPPPTHHYLDTEYERIVPVGEAMQWQQFFQASYLRSC